MTITDPIPQQVAFVVMPFGTKSTNLPEGNGPDYVDFDALWIKAIRPALQQLKYRPIRADNQEGAVIIKGMLKQLVHADLVVADVSIPNANVYYETGVRHSAKSDGCVLIGAEWTLAAFDLDQVRRIPYPLPANPTEEDYKKITENLVNNVPDNVNAENPVYELTQIRAELEGERVELEEAAAAIDDFEIRVRTAELKAGDGDLGALKEIAKLAKNEKLLPEYLYLDLLPIVRDKLQWSDALAYMESLPDTLKKHSFVVEQKALALAKSDEVFEAIALLEERIDSSGGTAEAYGLLGGRYKQLYQSAKNAVDTRRYLSKAIDAYEKGTYVDLNDYYCSSNLPVLYIERGKSEDQKKAIEVSTMVVAACKRAILRNNDDGWLKPTLLSNAFMTQNLAYATTLIEEIECSDVTVWQLESTLATLDKAINNLSDEKAKSAFEELVERLKKLIAIPQEELMEKLSKYISVNGAKYRKTAEVYARPGVEGEIITSIPSDGVETVNKAQQGDYIVKNATTAQEEYVVTKENFDIRYEMLDKQSSFEGGWFMYRPKGKVLAVSVSSLSDLLNTTTSFYIIASWGSTQIVHQRDFLVLPVPQCDEIYRIGEEAFGETYVAE